MDAPELPPESELRSRFASPDASRSSSELRLLASDSVATVPSGVRVLVADDDPRVRRAIATLVSRLGWEVRAVDDGAAAIALGEGTPFDLAVIDLSMPTSGLEVVRRLKTLYGSAVHVEILSGTDDREVRLAAFDAGADGFLVKPIPTAELGRRLIASARNQQAYIEARQAREQADRLLAWGTEAAALLAHDLNNGLAVALANATFLAQVVTLGEDDRDVLTSILRALRRMSGLVANFVDIARFEDDALRPRAAPVDVQGLLDEVMGVHAPSIVRGIRHVVRCTPGLTGFLDEALVARVLHNLVGNALRYCNAHGEIRLEGSPWIRPGHPGGVELRVQNTGPLIDPALASRLFGKYSLGKDGQRGLGLYFCRLACEAHGGGVRYEATPAGPSFVLSFPGSE